MLYFPFPGDVSTQVREMGVNIPPRLPLSNLNINRRLTPEEALHILDELSNQNEDSDIDSLQSEDEIIPAAETQIALNFEQELFIMDDKELRNQNNKTMTIVKKRPKLTHKRFENKRLRMEGENYKSYRINPNTKDKEQITREKRKLGLSCTSPVCKKSKLRNCSLFSEEERHSIFHSFWKQNDWDMRKTYVASLVDSVEPKRGKTDSRKAATIKYFLKKNSAKFQVCKNMFLSTLGLNEWSVRNWSQQSTHGSGMHSSITTISTPGRKRTSPDGSNIISDLKKYLEDLPKLPSHYCRSSTSKFYLEPVFKKKQDLYREYASKCQADRKKTLGRTMFFKEFNLQKLAIYKPKKDQCDTCVSYSLGNISEQNYSEHQQRKEEARKAKEKDKKLAIENKEEMSVFTMDVQAVKLAPCLKASAVYYKTKLCVHNFTLFDLARHDVSCFLWHEGEGGLKASVFASMIISYLEKHITEHVNTKQIIIYSDGCGYQNRNNLLSNALLNLAIKKNVIIKQNYLEKGHTQMEVDSTHSTIEERLKNREIYLPTDYISVCREARLKQPYTVNYLSHKDFNDYSGVGYYQSIRPGCRRGDPTVTDLRCLRYLPAAVIEYKLFYTDEWKPLPHNSITGPFQIKKLYKGPIKIKPEKFQHLQELKTVIPSYCWAFYDGLAH